MDSTRGSRPANGAPLRELAELLGRTTVMILLLSGSYYALPDVSPLRDATAGLRSGGVLLAWAGFAVVLRMQIRAVRARRSPYARAEALLTALYVLVLTFALLYDRVAAATTGQFLGIENRTDALYFAVSVVSTVGFGDVHATGTAARAIVTVQMLFGVMYLGTALRVLTATDHRPTLAA